VLDFIRFWPETHLLWQSERAAEGVCASGQPLHGPAIHEFFATAAAWLGFASTRGTKRCRRT